MKILYERYLKVYNRISRNVQWDVVGHSFDPFVVVFPFRNGQVRIIKEYCQGPDMHLYNLVSGAYDPKKHSSLLEAARSELSEEAHLRNGEFIALSPPIPELKWSINTFVPYLCLNPEADPNPLERDAEEDIQWMDVSLDHLNELILKGQMCLPAVQTCLMAIHRLKELNME